MSSDKLISDAELKFASQNTTVEIVSADILDRLWDRLRSAEEALKWYAGTVLGNRARKHFERVGG